RLLLQLLLLQLELECLRFERAVQLLHFPGTPLGLAPRLVGGLAGSEQLLFVFPPLAHLDQNTVVGECPVALAADSVDKDPELVPPLTSQQQEDLFGLRVQLDQGIEMGLIEDAPRNREDVLDVTP